MVELITDITAENLTLKRHKKLFNYWQAIKGDKAMPSRADFNPMTITDVLPSIILTEAHYDPLRFRIRLIGTEIRTVSGVDMTGSWLDEIPQTKDIVKRYKWIVKNKKPYFNMEKLKFELRDFINLHAIKDFTHYQALTLPFSNDGENVNIIISSGIYY